MLEITYNTRRILSNKTENVLYIQGELHKIGDVEHYPGLTKIYCYHYFKQNAYSGIFRLSKLHNTKIYLIEHEEEITQLYLGMTVN